MAAIIAGASLPTNGGGATRSRGGQSDGHRSYLDRSWHSCVPIRQVRLSLLDGSAMSNRGLSLTDWSMLHLAHLGTFLDISSCRDRDGGSILSDRIKGVRGGFVESSHQMAVRVQCRSNRSVAQPVLKHLGMDAVCDEHGGVAVAEVMESERLADRGANRRCPDSPAEAGAPCRPTLGS